MAWTAEGEVGSPLAVRGSKAPDAEIVGASGRDFPPAVRQRGKSRLGDVNAKIRTEDATAGGRSGPLARHFLAHEAEINSKEGQRRGGVRQSHGNA